MKLRDNAPRDRRCVIRALVLLVVSFLGLVLGACTPAQERVAARATPIPTAITRLVGEGESHATVGAGLAPAWTVTPTPTRLIAPPTAPNTTESSQPEPTTTHTLAPTPTGTPTPAATWTPVITQTAIPLRGSATRTPGRAPTTAQIPTVTVRIAVIGDYGLASRAEKDVAALVKGWRPDLVITTGDNNYPSGSAATIDVNVGQYYHDFIYPYAGRYGQGADGNRFFPALGNHDWVDPGAKAYLDYFTLPGNERYYDFAWGPLHFFALDSMSGEPDGITVKSKQAAWLRKGLAAAQEPWKLVYMHHPPFSSGPHGSTKALQWPYGEWGATAVLAGHDHTYERIVRDGIPYFVNGLAGSVKYAFLNPVRDSQARYNADFGAMLIEASETQITFQFIARTGEVIDTYTVKR